MKIYTNKKALAKHIRETQGKKTTEQTVAKMVKDGRVIRFENQKNILAGYATLKELDNFIVDNLIKL